MLTALRRPTLLVPIAIVAVAVVAVGLYLFQPWRLFTNVTVDEALPTVSAPESVTASASASAAEPAPSASPAAPASPPPSASPAAPAEQLEPAVLATGKFISHEHGTSGTVRILELADGSRVLRIEDLDTDNGPDLKVWLAAAPVIDGVDGWFVFDDGPYVDLGSLKGNKGNQNYRIPPDVDLAQLSSVTIWCDRFSVSFGAAALTTV